MFLAPSHSDLGDSLLITTLLGIPLGEPGGKTPTAGAHRGASRQISSEEFDGILHLRLSGDRRRNLLHLGLWVCVANRSGGFSSHLINPTNTRAPQQKQFGGTTSAEILLPGIAKEIENLSLSDSTPTHFPFELKNSAMSYSTLSHRWNWTRTRTLPLFGSYPDSDDDFDSNSDSLDC